MKNANHIVLSLTTVFRTAFSISIAVILSGTIFFGSAGSEEKKSNEIKKQLIQEKSELKTLQKKIEIKKARIQETKKKEKKVISELNRIEKKLSLKQREYKRYAVNLKKAKKEIGNINNEIETLQAELTEQETNLSCHIRSLYKLSRIDMTKALFFSDSFLGLMRKCNYMIRVVDYNVGVINTYSKTLETVRQHKQLLKKNEKDLKSVTEKSRLTKKQILHHKKEKTTLLAKVKTEKELHLEALEELEQASRRLQALIDKLEKGMAVDGAKSFSLYKTKLSFPVAGEVITYFGKHEDPEFSTVSFNKGIEIIAKTGTEIQSVFDGAVIYSDWFKGYGNIVIIDHGNGYYTISGHASELFKKVGDHVKKGEPVGLVGDTGSLKGPNLYFEIRHHGQPLDPLDWLKP